MEVKKSPKADLQNKRSLFLLTGLIVALIAVYGMFNWSQKEVGVTILEQETVIIEQEVVEQTRHEEPPKVEPPKVVTPVVSDILEITDSKIKASEEFNFDSEFSEDAPIVIKQVGGGEEDLMKEEVPVLRAETMPSFNGKANADATAEFRQWVGRNIQYPPLAEENNITGRVTIRFVIERDGSVSSVEALASPDKLLSDEAIRVVSKSPKWTPGEQRGKKVRVAVIVPIDFRL
ncbi:MAG: energy transducer TonB [Rikenellaceae bacterium]|nr:energy transducer TonB [Rikenellaceae bacterium]